MGVIPEAALRSLKALTVIAAIGIVLVVPACGGDEDEEAQPSASPAATTTEPPAPGVTTEAQIRDVEGRAPTASELVGTWAKIGEALLWKFNADGTFAFDRVNLDSPFASGTYAPKGSTIRFVAMGSCFDRWGWKAGIVGGDDPLDDELDIVFLSDACDEIAGARWTLARISR